MALFEATISCMRLFAGTSNWSGDYFHGNTGVALVVSQAESKRRPFVDEMKAIFIRDWDSDYAHALKTYYELCVRRNDASFCQAEKDPSLLDTSH